MSLPDIGHHCQTCALPISDALDTHCGVCLQSLPPYSRTEACWIYEAPVAQLIAGYKYHRRLSYGITLAKIASIKFASAYIQTKKPDFITATPLHWKRHLYRGFNQCDVLTQYFSQQLQVPIFTHIKRSKPTKKQLLLPAEERQVNLKDVFSIGKSDAIAGKLIAVVDDVMTTGATAKSISQTFLDAGAREVHILVLARTPR